MPALEIKTPRVFAPLLEPARFKGAHGGRGSAKSHFFAGLMIEEAYSFKEPYKAVGIREVQKSIQFSVKELLYEKICQYNLNDHFEVQDQQIKCLRNDGFIIFQGMQNHTEDSIKSLQGFKRFWAEEAQSISHSSLRKLRPTLREPGSQLWASWNPENETDAIDQFMRHPEVANDKNFIVVEANWRDNPWFPEELELERQIDLKRNPDDYAHIWEGKYLSRSNARVFSNWTVEDFETPSDAALLFGADFGFSQDPTTLIRGFIGKWGDDHRPIADSNGRTLFLDYEAYKIGCRIEDTPKLFDEVPEARNWACRADSARPEMIDYLQRNGFPKMTRSTKGANSVKEGVEFLKSYDIVIHRRCKHTQKEFTLYSYKVDKKTEEILPVLEDANNHLVDSCRYAIEIIRKNARLGNMTSGFGPRVILG